MKLLLTSGGLKNKTISDALLELVGKPASETSIVFIPTAANVEEGDKGWLINDLQNLNKQGYKSVDIVDISAVEQNIWESRLQAADVLFFGGGNTFHLMYWIEKSGLGKLLPELLKTRVYAGISAGSCVTRPTIYNSVQNLFGETYKLNIKEGLKLVDFKFIPHFNSQYFSKLRETYIKKPPKNLSYLIYA